MTCECGIEQTPAGIGRRIISVRTGPGNEIHQVTAQCDCGRDVTVKYAALPADIQHKAKIFNALRQSQPREKRVYGKQWGRR